jgi:thiosulfate/3-mercaptopyruvate sulfurtransferase
MSYITAEPLVSAGWLVDRLGAPDLCILDIRSGAAGLDAYRRGHVPGALHSNYGDDGWRVVRGMAQGLLPDAASLSALFARFGITPETHVIVLAAAFNAGDFSAAARVYWTFRVAGHRRVSILDGGMEEWSRDPARKIETGENRAKTVPPYPVRFDPSVRAELTAVEAAVARDSAVLLDSRAQRFFEGSDKSASVARAGRLPGAFLIDHAALFTGTPPRLKDRSELKALFVDLPSKPVVNYCNTGQQAAANWFVLSELLGRPDVTLYDGSMSEWAENPARIVEIGRRS